MKKIFISFIFFLLLITNLFPIYAQATAPRLAACDLCGYCPPNPPPSSWKKCSDCLYDIAGAPPESGLTLKIDENTNAPQGARPGRVYTMLGCMSTSMGGIESGGKPAASVVQALLNVIFSIAGGLGFLSLIYGSFIIITSQSNPEKLRYGKKIIYGAIVGVIFSISSVFLVNLIGSGILKIPGFNSTPTP